MPLLEKPREEMTIYERRVLDWGMINDNYPEIPGKSVNESLHKCFYLRIYAARVYFHARDKFRFRTLY